METAAIRAGDTLSVGGIGLEANVRVKTSDGRKFQPGPIRISDLDNGVVFTYLVDQKPVKEVRVFVSPRHEVRVLPSATQSVYLTEDAVYDTTKYDASVQWILISLELSQRVQRMKTWALLVGDVQSAVRYVTGGADDYQLPEPWAASSRVHEAALRLMAIEEDDDDDEAREIKLPHSGQTIRVSLEKSAKRVAELAMNPSAAIQAMGAHAAEALIAYLSIPVVVGAVPEVLVAQPGPASVPIVFDRYVDLDNHGGLSLVAVARRRRLADDVWDAVAVHQLFLLPTDVPAAPPGAGFGVPARRRTTEFPFLLAGLTQQYSAGWNNYNIGYRGSQWYALPGEYPRAATEVFNMHGRSSTPLAVAAGESAGGTFYPGTRSGSALYMSLADLGDDPFLKAMTVRSSDDPVKISTGAVDSFAPEYYWTPRRLEGAVMSIAPASRSSQEVEQVGAAITEGDPALERAVLIEEFDNIARDLERGYKLDAVDKTRARYRSSPFEEVANDNRFDKTKLPAMLLSYHNAEHMTIQQLAAQNGYLSTAADEARAPNGSLRVLAFARAIYSVLGTVKNGARETPVFAVAEKTSEMVNARALRLETMRIKYPSLPPVDERLTFADVSERVLRRTVDAEPTAEELDFVRTFGRIDRWIALMLAMLRSEVMGKADDGGGKVDVSEFQAKQLADEQLQLQRRQLEQQRQERLLQQEQEARMRKGLEPAPKPKPDTEPEKPSSPRGGGRTQSYLTGTEKLGGNKFDKLRAAIEAYIKIEDNSARQVKLRESFVEQLKESGAVDYFKSKGVINEDTLTDTTRAFVEANALRNFETLPGWKTMPKFDVVEKEAKAASDAEADKKRQEDEAKKRQEEEAEAAKKQQEEAAEAAKKRLDETEAAKKQREDEAVRQAKEREEERIGEILRELAQGASWGSDAPADEDKEKLRGMAIPSHLPGVLVMNDVLRVMKERSDKLHMDFVQRATALGMPLGFAAKFKGASDKDKERFISMPALDPLADYYLNTTLKDLKAAP